MAFMGILMITILFILIILGVSTICAVILLVISHILKKKESKKYIVIRVLAIIFFIPDLLFVLLILWSIVSSWVKYHDSLAYYVMEEDYEKAEQLLENGAQVDCTLDSNDKAKEGEKTLLYILCDRGFLYLDGGDRHGYYFYEEEPERLENMINFLLEHGADPNHRVGGHEKDYEGHFYQIESDYYAGSDECGYTPFLLSVRKGDLELTKAMMKAGADVNTTDYCGFNAIATAIECQSKDSADEYIEYLKSQGCSDDVETNFRQSIEFLYYRNFEQ